MFFCAKSIKIKNMKKLITLIFIGICCVAVQAQTRNCGTMQHLDEIKQNDPQVEQRMQVEESVIQNWIANNPESLMPNVISIPVVVHIVYNTSAQNVSDNDVYSQIQVLNEDFRKTNPDASSVPSAFSGVAADCEIEFCLAVRDPSGNTTNGITRTYTSSSSFSTNDNMKHNSSGGKDAWSTSDYLNIWVCNISGSILGYAQFPNSGSANEDGIVIDYAYFGDISATYPYHKGRTATHEVGHWLNLRHIWGDATCGNDYVSDTPTQASSNGGCPSFPSTSSCTGNAPNGDMFMNYMDYTYDACMYMFSAGQKTRMRATLNGSRSSLQSSNGCVPVNVPIVATASVIDVNCNGGNDGAIDVTISGGLSPFTYLWNTGATTQDLSNLSPGNYTITVTDAQGQVQTSSYTVSEPAIVSTSYTSVSASAPGLSDGAIYTTTTGGVLPYSYYWVSPYATTQNLLNIGAGTYTFYAIDANSCFSTAIIVVQGVAIIDGCTDSIACNYDPLANNDDGTCNVSLGCTDATATNYDSTACIDDGSCIAVIYGCTNPLAINYYPGATTDDGSCTYPCADNEVVFTGLDQGGDTWTGGMYYVTNSLGDTVATGDGMGAWYDDNYGFGPLNTFDDTLCLPTGCYDLTFTAGNWAAEMAFEFAPLNSSWNYAFVGAYIDISIGGALCGIINGCTDPLAINYDATATVDDGSCTYPVYCNAYPTGLNVFDVIDTRVNFAWDNMNTTNCMVLKYYVRYREVGASAWNTRAAGVGNGLCNFGLNTTSQMLLGLTASTTYEWKLKAFYCGGSSSNYSPVSTFTTSDACPILANLAVQTYSGNHTKANFTWDSTGTYTYARVALRVDVTGSAWQTVGGFGTFAPALSQIKFGLTAGESYRAGARAYCNANISSHRSWWTPFIFWTQPGTAIKLEGGAAINNLDIYPNPSRDIFNISFTSEDKQDLKVRILNVIGEELINENLEQFIGEYTKQINLSDNAKGIYFLEIETNDGIINKKLILQ